MEKTLVIISKALAEMGIVLSSTLFGAFLAINLFKPVNNLFWGLLGLIGIGIGVKVWAEYVIHKAP